MSGATKAGHPAGAVPLSVAVITLNEEANLERCLSSVTGIASEIVVIDSRSTDRTLEIAAKYGARVEVRDWPGHVKQKNYALEACAHEWVLSLDADEALSDELRASIQRLFSEGEPQQSGLRINRRTFYLGRWIWHAWYPEWRLRLVRRSRARWYGVDPHDVLRVEGVIGKLQGDLLHYSYKDLHDHFLRTIKYARIGAEARLAAGAKFKPLQFLFSPWFRLFKTMVLRQAWRDGWRGWLIAFMSLLAAFARYAFILEAHLQARDRAERERSRQRGAS